MSAAYKSYGRRRFSHDSDSERERVHQQLEMIVAGKLSMGQCTSCNTPSVTPWVGKLLQQDVKVIWEAGNRVDICLTTCDKHTLSFRGLNSSEQFH